MASKTVARSGARTSRSKSSSRSSQARRSPARRPAKAPRRPARRRHHSLVTNAGLACGRAVRGTWLMLAKGTGSTARSVGRAREIDPGHRRDGIALALLGVAVVIAASSWFDAARPVGAWVDAVLRTFIGGAGVVPPVVTAAVAVVLMRTQPDPEARPRVILGASLITLSVLGLRHLWSGSTEDPELRRRAAGFTGSAIGGPWSDGLTPWIAAPLLFIGFMFGLLLLTGTTIREGPVVMRALFHTRFVDEDLDEPYDYADEFDDEVDEDNQPTEDLSVAKEPAWEADPDPVPASPEDTYDETPTIPEPSSRSRRRAKKQDTLELDRVVEG